VILSALAVSAMEETIVDYIVKKGIKELGLFLDTTDLKEVRVIY
jgi:hypothetical protein